MFVKKTTEYVNDYKTYLVAVAAIVLGVLDGFGVITIPTWALTVLSFTGLAAVRHGIQKGKVLSEEVLKELRKEKI